MNHSNVTPFRLLLLVFISFAMHVTAQVAVGSGSYTTNFPGTDEAGRNGFPSGSPQLSGAAAGKPVPTNDWWSKLIKEDHADNLFNYPMTMKTTNTGLIVTYIPFGVIGDSAPIEIGLSGLNTNRATVSDYSDWTVTMNWNDGSHELKATSGIGMPFLYFEKEADDILEIKVNGGTATVIDELLIIENASGDADFVFYAPSGGTWTNNGSTYTSTLNGKNYWSMAMLPQSISNVNTVANEYKKYAYVFPTNTTTEWSYNANTGLVQTNFLVTTVAMEGSETNILQGLLPHQWDNLSSMSATPNGYSYKGVRGEIKTLDGNGFIVENTFRGILPTMPYLANYSEGFDPSELEAKIAQIENDQLATWTDSYNEGQVMNRLIQSARVADQTGNTEARDKMIATIKERLEDWLTYQSGEKAFLFYYNNTWSAMLGYPAGHGQDTNINDHHFHWGYFIHAAAFMEQFEPGWADDWGGMINLLIRDAASVDRNDSQFPFLRNFSPYGGHCWANGMASFPQGNDQESTSESMQFNSSLIHWGTITGNDAIRDLGIYLYTTEQTAIEEYWFDMSERNFGPSQQYSLVSRVWGNSYDNGTFWTSDITASYGIELYPMHGGSLYLGQNKAYVAKIWEELKTYTEILSTTSTNPNLWHDTIWKYLCFIDPQQAVDLYNSYPTRIMKFGVSDVQTYHWLHTMNAMGTLEASLTADYPIAAAFNKNGDITYVAHNYSDAPITVTFSNGFTLDVPANQIATNKDVRVSGVLSSDFNQAYPNGSVNLSVQTNGPVSKVEFFDGTILLGEITTAPYQIKASNLVLGTHGMYAKVYEGAQFNVTNIVNIQVGEQVPYTGTAIQIPGTFDAAHYDAYEGGNSQGIAYVDVSQNNQGDFRMDEYVDAVSNVSEGAVVGWTSAGEWVEYTIDVQTAGVYDLSFRYASGNPAGGGPFYFEIEGTKISPDILVTPTSSSNWTTWANKTVNNIELNKGIHVLKMVFDNGELNIGRLTFARTGDLSYNPPVAHAGDNVSVILPNTTATLDGSQSTDADTPVLNYNWEQIYGPSTIAFSSTTVASPNVSSLEEGIYKVKLTVDDGSHTSNSTSLIIVTQTGNVVPTISISNPSDNSIFKEGEDITITASATDLDGTVAKVEFYDGTTKIGEDDSEPYSFEWSGASIGAHQISAKATDNAGGEGTSQTINISVDEVKLCEETGNSALQGAFSMGYKSTFETIGSDVIITFELLDNDKFSGNAYLWQETPFAESQMDFVETNKFTKMISGVTNGETLSYACKFEFSGGLAVTSYVQYVVGTDCSGGNDTEAPTNFTAAIGAITSTSVELLLNGTDNSGTVVYNVSYNSGTNGISGDSGVQQSLGINALQAETLYTFTVTASDLAGNNALNNPIVIQATTAASANTACSGISSEAQQGAFDIGYNYNFETSGTEVIFTFELLDNKDGVIAYLWQQSPFNEIAMTPVSGKPKAFSTSITGQTSGTTIRYACKFAFAGGLAVTKYFAYEVGDRCVLGSNEQEFNSFSVYPNPSQNSWHLKSSQELIESIVVFNVHGKKIMTVNPKSKLVTLDAYTLESGIYFARVKTLTGLKSIKLIKR
ncbi:glycosyl hydrolase [Algibacter mikhailovii]|uniref:glycosyl hydrolase n=1 Tax=Algibacter mikhailovii TaxID=425498 RepID=UPI0024948281|nr:glycosyl hydrolase [Algibacter mikhailovii]